MRNLLLAASLLSVTATACATDAPEDDVPEAPTYEEDLKADNAFESRLEGTKNEWGEVIRPTEAIDFAQLAIKINEIQRKLSVNGEVKRGFHAKMHGCLKAEFRPDANRAAVTRQGVFASDDVKQAWVRLSNGQGKTGPDNDRDVRGIAIKLLDVAGDRLINDGATTQDFLMTNRPASHVNDALEFMEFAEAAADGKLIGWGLLHPVAAARLFRATAPVTTLVTKYWTGSPYRFGDNIAKLAVWPCSGQATGTIGTTTEYPDYLRGDLESRLERGDICYQFGVQIRKEPSNESVEKGSSVWDEVRNPMVPIGKLVITQRDVGQKLADEEMCNDLSFNPWNGIQEHRPLGHMNRARQLVYRASAELRGHIGEPTAE